MTILAPKAILPFTFVLHWIGIFVLLPQTQLCSQNNKQWNRPVRVATFNVSLFRNGKNQLVKDLAKRSFSKARKIAEILQRVRPDVVLLNEFDYDAEQNAISLFQKHFLEVSQNNCRPIRYPYRFLASVNTGLPTGLDLDQDGKSNGPGDAFGFGRFPGQYGMVVLSRFPIEKKLCRTFQKFLWKDMPGARIPIRKDGTKFYSNDAWEKFRLSSKSHWDVGIRIGEQPLHFLVSHPTPPVFDQEEDRNGKRNHDEIRFWNDYINPRQSGYIYDDSNLRGGLQHNAKFVIAGDLNADPHDGDSTGKPTSLFLANPLINNSQTPKSQGAVGASAKGTANRKHKGDPACDTAEFNPFKVGNLRIDYVLPSKNLEIRDSGVFWPADDSALVGLIKASDHRLVFVDLLPSQDE